MKLIPFSIFSINVNLDELAVRERLEEHTERFWTNSRVLDEGTTFEGMVNKNGFKIRRNIEGRNSFVPIFTGRFESDGSGTKIRIVARMYLFTILFMAFWLGFAAKALITNLMSDSGLWALPVFMFVGGWALMNYSFWSEFSTTLSALNRILE